MDDGVPQVSYAVSNSGNSAAWVSRPPVWLFRRSGLQASGPVSDMRSDWVVISRVVCWATHGVDSRGRPDTGSEVGLESLLLAEGAQSRRVMRVGYTLSTGRVLYEDCMVSYASN